MPLKPSRELVLKKVHDCFPKNTAEALSIIHNYGTEAWHLKRERVQLAVLMQANGRIDHLQLLVAEALRDYRDALVVKDSTTSKKSLLCSPFLT